MEDVSVKTTNLQSNYLLCCMYSSFMLYLQSLVITTHVMSMPNAIQEMMETMTVNAQIDTTEMERAAYVCPYCRMMIWSYDLVHGP